MLFLLAFALGAYRARVFNVMEFGAVGDGRTKDTQAVKDAVAAVARAGSGTVFFPSDHRFLVAPFNLTSHCTVYVDANSSLIGSTDPDDWPLIPALPSYGQDVIVTGANGTVDGQGQLWWAHRPGGFTPGHLIEFMWSSHVEVSHLTLINSPFWTVHPWMVAGFLADRLTILNPRRGTKNTDGIDPDSSRDVLIRDCYIETGDDGVAIKSGWDEYGYEYGQPSANITVRGCTISTPCAAVAIGSEMSGGVSDVLVTNCTLRDSTAGVHIKSGAGRGGFVRDISFADLRLDGCAEGFMITTDDASHPADDGRHRLNLSALPDLRRIAFANITGRGSTTVAKIVGLPQRPVVEVTFEDVHFDGGGYDCASVNGTYRGVTPQPCSALSPKEKSG